MSAAERPEQIAIIRHGEKPPPGGPAQGIDEDGMPHVHSLVVRGWQRAGALANFFCVSGDPAIRCPTRLFSPPRHGKDGDHGRPFETLLPLAAKLGAAIDVTYVLDQEEQLATRALASGGVVLIAWEHKRIPKIANAILGNDTTAPQAWPDERFDLVWVFDRQPGGDYAPSRSGRKLVLGGDRIDVVPKG